VINLSVKENVKRLVPDEDDKKDGITFDKQGRMQYHPDFHPNHGKPFSTSDLIYLCKYHKLDGPRGIGFALGKTEQTISVRLNDLRRDGDYEFYRNISDADWLRLKDE
jgi:hypothetical protein